MGLAGLGASVILPKHLLTAAMSGRITNYEHLLRDNYETPFYAPELGGSEFELGEFAGGFDGSLSKFTRSRSKRLRRNA